MKVDRRQFVQRAVAGTAQATALGVAGARIASAAPESPSAPLASPAAPSSAAPFGDFPRGNPLAVSTYSFWRFKDDSKLSIERCIDEAARIGFDAVEILHIQMENDEPSYLQRLKQRALVNGLDLCGFSTHQGFLSPDERVRQENVDNTIRHIEIAYALGIPTIRVNTGRWGTTKSFDQLMAQRGIEPRLEGYSDEDGFGWVIGAFEKCIPTAEKCGVTLGLEHHWGLGLTPEGVLRIVEAVDSPWLQCTLDTGNFLEDPYD